MTEDRSDVSCKRSALKPERLIAEGRDKRYHCSITMTEDRSDVSCKRFALKPKRLIAAALVSGPKLDYLVR
jgi:hypothetical protein